MVSVGLSCCCTPPPGSQELGACCYTEEVNGLLQPNCIPSLTEAECATYENSYFSAGLPCGDLVSCGLSVLGPVGDKGIYEAYVPVSRWSPAHRETEDALSQELLLPDNFGIFSNPNPENRPRANESLGQLYQNHLPVNYFFFSTNDDSLYLYITLYDNVGQGEDNNLKHKARIFDFTAEAQAQGFNKNTCTNIVTNDGYAGLPNLLWLDENGKIKNLIGDDLYEKRYLRLLQYVDWTGGGNDLEGYDLFSNTIFKDNAKYSQISSKYGGRITAIYANDDVRAGRVVSAGSHFAGAAVRPLTGEDQWDIFDPRSISSSTQIIGSTNNPGDIDGFAGFGNGSSYDNFDSNAIGYPNLNNTNKSGWYNTARTNKRCDKVASIRNAVKIEENFFATAVLTSDGAIYTWGSPTFGGDDLYNNVKYFDFGFSSQFLFLNSENQQTETATDYVDIMPISRGFLGFRQYDGANNVTFFGSFVAPNATIFQQNYEDFLANGKRYEPADAVRLNDGGIILKAFGEDSYTIVGGHNGSAPVIGNVTPPSAGLTIKKAFSAYQDNRSPFGSVEGISASLYLILWSNGDLQCVSFTRTLDGKDTLFDGALSNPDDYRIYQYDWSRWMDEITVNNRERIFTDVQDVFLCHNNYGFGYVLNSPDPDGYNCHLILRTKMRQATDTRPFDAEQITQDIANLDGVVIEKILTQIYANAQNSFGQSFPDWETGFSKVSLKDIDYVDQSAPDANTLLGPKIDSQASNIQDNGAFGGRASYYVTERENESSTFFFINKEENGIELINNERVILGLHYNGHIKLFSSRQSVDRFLQHTRLNPVDSKTEDAGSPIFNFDYVNAFGNSSGFVLDSPGYTFNNTNQSSSNFISEPTQRDLRSVDVFNRSTGESSLFSTADIAYVFSYENCAPEICFICLFGSRKCNEDTGECYECFDADPNSEYDIGLPNCSENPEFNGFPWSEPQIGTCLNNPCPPPSIVGCCCATYQRSPEEPIWFQQQVSTISAVLTEEGIASYLAETPGCLGGGGGTYYDGSIIRPEDITYTFTPIDPPLPGSSPLTELQCGADYNDENFVQLCGPDLGSSAIVSIDNVSFSEPCTDLQTTKLVDIIFRKNVQGIRVNVEYEIPGLEQALTQLGCTIPQNIQGNITFLEDEYTKIVTLPVCCELTGQFVINYTVTPI